MAGAVSSSTSLKEYLKKYTSNDDEKKKSKKRKKKKDTKANAAGVLVLDEDPVWQKPVNLDEEEEDSADEEKPQVDEDIEVKRMRRLELLKLKRPYGAISEDGSGWVSVSETRSSLKSEDQNSDISPPRKSRQRNDTPSPRPDRKSEILADTDLSPPRKSHKHHQSPPGTETGPSRSTGARSARFDTPSPEPHLRASVNDRETDLSPPRRKQRELTDPEKVLSHPKLMDSDISPPRRSRRDPRSENDSRASADFDLSPPRKTKSDRSGSVRSARKPVHYLEGQHTSDRTTSVSDLSPPRKRKNESPSVVHKRKTGLVTGGDMKDENEKKMKEDFLRFQELDPSISGRDAEPVYRDKLTGKRMSKQEFLKSQKKEEKPKEIKLEWGKGLAQKREVEARLKELEAEKEKPFARSRDDPDLDSMLKERVRWGDPMAHLVKKKNVEPVLPDLGDSERMKESGFIIPQEVPSHSWIRRGVDAPPNRYGIKPGRHWDGVDRSNGYEKEMYKRMNEKSATEREAYLWSVSEM
ncbi:uncharacterized protein LOC127265969 [Andrographis paniculata]|uniref:uncharacterized protein LOC127265969 n=1 Tax=Andrographis paniculata TaxID=175694 RepID=UPI0021E8801C|nr:uncharacterized protein LOC127265969 [Andrographis paniculata]